ncbi:LysR family transcriptional regulator [Rhizobium sp. G21]|uniref:LysR family transcriptional regulator n=1 Tax=Rhizobium sp. G21 TaxID=2758439 RepID=UPI0016004593|nr:LysR family transcriptional regulator [Rhizobium sp. G21]MBB1249756.1 LysR family transcriptional regulator [Rhizobium sp. G21]
MDLDWNLIRSFVTVAESGSLIAAARRIGVSQPALGRHIDELERQLGLTLFSRGRAGMRLTEAGMALLEDARSIRSDVDHLLLRAAGQSDRVSGPVRITASQVMATYVLPPMLARLKQAEPGLDIELASDNAIANLLARDADIAIRMARPAQNDLIAQKIGDLALGCFAHRDYVARRGAPVSLKEFGEHDLVGYDRVTRILDAMGHFGLTMNRSDFGFRTDDEVAQWELVRAGGGIGFAQLAIAARDADLQRLLTDLPLPRLPLWLAAHQELKTNRRIRRALDFLQGELKAYAAECAEP